MSRLLGNDPYWQKCRQVMSELLGRPVASTEYVLDNLLELKDKVNEQSKKA